MAANTDDRRMSDAEGLMWRLEKDPMLSSTFANVTILDRPPDFDALRRRMERAAMVIPRLRMVVRTAPGNVSPPVWVEDSDFNIDRHVRRIALPEPGTERQLFDLATLLVADPFDRTKPLWQFIVVEGLEGGRAAMVQKLHHTISDGEGMIKLSLEFFDFERDAPFPPMPETIAAAPTDPDIAAADMVRDLMAGSMRFPVGVAKQVKELLSDPARIPGATVAAGDTLRGIVNQLSDTEQAHSPLWTARSTRRHLEVSTAPFTETRAAARQLGGTLNTAFLTIATEAASRYHLELGAPVENLRASMAVSTRTAESGANAFSLVRMLVPTAEMSVAERFRAIQEATDAAVGNSKSASLETLATVAATLPTSILTRLARQQSQTVDFATSNVKGSPVPMFCAGAQLLNNYAVGPLSGVAFNVTLLSYLGRLDMGINIDEAAVAEPALLRRHIDDAVSDLCALG